MEEEVRALAEAISQNNDKGEPPMTHQPERILEHEPFEYGNEITDIQTEKHQTTQKSKIQCEECDTSFTTRYASKRHFNSFHAPTATKKLKVKDQSQSSLKRFHCTICGEGFTRLEGVEKHKSRFHPDSSTPRFACQICGNEFTYYNLRDHTNICLRRQQLSQAIKSTFETLRPCDENDPSK